MTQNENPASEAAQDEILSSILQKLSSSPSAAPPPSEPSNTGSAPMGDILSSLLSNPELISKLPGIISSIKPIIELFGQGISSTPASVSVSAAPASPPQTAPASALARSNHGADSRTALLYAMKPYLSSDRQNAIDYIVKIGRLGDILKTL